MHIPVGTLVNTGAVLVGGTIGTFLIPQIPEAVKRTVIKAIGLGVCLLGLKMAWPTNEVFLILVSLVTGATVGQLLRIEERLHHLALVVERVAGEGKGDFARTFVRISLLFCVGAMSITGALADGLGNPSILYAKAVLDGVGAVMFASALGIGVLFTAVPVLVYQGMIALAAGWLTGLLTPAMIDAVSASGGLLILGIGLNLIEAAEIPVGNILPAIPILMLLVALRPVLPWLPH